jgi:hypothetical protein
LLTASSQITGSVITRVRFTLLGVALALCAPLGAQAQTPGAGGPSFQAFIFGDVLYKATDADATDGFGLGQTVAHGNATLSENLVFFGEVSITARGSSYSLAMERMILRYEFSDPLKISAGRYHTPISYWNTEFHHGLWLQGSVARPEAIRFGSRYVPVHFVGAMAEGNFTDFPLFYSAGVGNGRSESLSGGGDSGDANGKRAAIVSASIRPRSLYGFRVGGAVYFDRITEGGVDLVNERIASAHIVWDRVNVEAIAEFIHVSHDELATDATTTSPSWYAHLGYRLPGSLRSLTPYARYEDIDIDAQDIVFTGVLADYEAAIAGVRWDFESFAALKGEYRGEKIGDGDRANSWFVQASFAIPVAGGG